MIELINGVVTKYKSSHPSNEDEELIVFPLGLIIIDCYESVTIVLDETNKLLLASAIETLFERGYKSASSTIDIEGLRVYWSNRGEPYRQGIVLDTSELSVFVDDYCAKDLVKDLKCSVR